jgi:5'-3' exonuclease
MQPLIDCDILLYEVAYKCQQKNEEGEIIPSSWEEVERKFDSAVQDICAEVYATEPPILYLTGKGNFRNDVATIRPYKGNRKKEKPFHYKNIKAYAMAAYDYRLVEGLEADDLMSIEQVSRLRQLDTCICSRDKDLLIVPGLHYSWEVRGQPRFGPAPVSELGELQLKKGGKKLFGTGLKLFYSQLLTGDKVDNIPGIRGYGPVKVFNLLNECENVYELEEVVKGVYGEDGMDRMLEVGRLLWMTQKLDEVGKPVLWNFNNA